MTEGMRPNFDVDWETLSELDKKSLIALVSSAEFEVRRGNELAIKYIKLEGKGLLKIN